jgi:phosphinothricin acetyltransferase
MIRLATSSDAAPITAIYAPAVTDRATSFELEPPDATEMARRIEKTLARTPWLVCEHDGVVLGYAYAGPHRERAAYRWSVEVSAYVHPDAWRRGVGRALYASLFALLARQGFRNAYAGVTLPNDASVGLHRAVGFTPVGVFRGVGFKFGAWHDVAWFERPLLPRASDPPEPVPLREMDADALREGLAAGLPLLRPAP